MRAFDFLIWAYIDGVNPSHYELHYVFNKNHLSYILDANVDVSIEPSWYVVLFDDLFEREYKHSRLKLSHSYTTIDTSRGKVLLIKIEK